MKLVVHAHILLFFTQIFISCESTIHVSLESRSPQTSTPSTPAVAITNFKYSYNELILGNGIAATSITPSFAGTEITFSVVPSLPLGLSLDTSTGVISGTPTANVIDTSYTITAANSQNSQSFVLEINIALPIIVDTTIDGTDDNAGGDATCFSTGASGCSLRAAVQTANNAGSRRVIILDLATYSIGSVLPAIAEDMIILGKSQTTTMIEPPSANPGYGLFAMNTAGKTFKLSHVRVNDFGSTDGAVLNITAGTFEGSFNFYFNNLATNGGVFEVTTGATLTSKYSHFEQNTGVNWGGVLNIESVGSSATFEGIYATKNHSAYGGFSHAADGNINIFNSTLFQNSSDVGGVTASPGGSYVIRNSTITENFSTTATGTAGIYFFNSFATYTISNTIISDNTQSDADPSDCFKNGGFGTLTSEGGNIISDTGGNCAAEFNGTGDQLSTDPQIISPSADNGGYTLSLLIQTTSPAIDAGQNANCLSIDQFGTPRPLPYNGATALCDVGAIEMVK